MQADPELLDGREALLVAGRRVAIERRAGVAERPILRLEGSSTREDAEGLRGQELRVPLDEAPPLAEGEFWAHELVGCHVVDGERAVGVVERMVALPSCEALAVGEMLIPLVRDAIRSVDLKARRIEVDMAFLGE